MAKSQVRRRAWERREAHYFLSLDSRFSSPSDSVRRSWFIRWSQMCTDVCEKGFRKWLATGTVFFFFFSLAVDWFEMAGGVGCALELRF